MNMTNPNIAVQRLPAISTTRAVAAPDNVQKIVSHWNRLCGKSSVPSRANCKTVERPNNLPSITELGMVGDRGVWHPLGLAATDDHTVHEALKHLYRQVTGGGPIPFDFPSPGA